MFHKNRIWHLTPIATAEELAHNLTQRVWTGCTGFNLNDVFYLNDATSADGAQEYAVVIQKGDDFIQLESVTFGWMKEARALQFIKEFQANPYWDFAVKVPVTLDDNSAHRCHLCW